MVGPGQQRTTLADGAGPSKSVASSHESRAGSARDGKGLRGRKGEMGAREDRKQHLARHFPLQPNSRSSNSRSNCSNSAPAVTQDVDALDKRPTRSDRGRVLGGYLRTSMTPSERIPTRCAGDRVPHNLNMVTFQQHARHLWEVQCHASCSVACGGDGTGCRPAGLHHVLHLGEGVLLAKVTLTMSFARDGGDETSPVLALQSLLHHSLCGMFVGMLGTLTMGLTIDAYRAPCRTTRVASLRFHELMSGSENVPMYLTQQKIPQWQLGTVLQLVLHLL